MLDLSCGSLSKRDSSITPIGGDAAAFWPDFGTAPAGLKTCVSGVCSGPRRSRTSLLAALADQLLFVLKGDLGDVVPNCGATQGVVN